MLTAGTYVMEPSLVSEKTLETFRIPRNHVGDTIHLLTRNEINLCKDGITKDDTYPLILMKVSTHLSLPTGAVNLSS